MSNVVLAREKGCLSFALVLVSTLILQPFNSFGEPKERKALENNSTTPRAECVRRDEIACDEECRELFGEDYRSCHNDCLEKRCEKRKPEQSDRSRKSDVLCVELESERCAVQCRAEPPSARNHCRKECIEERCPEASRYDSALEAIEPGRTKCERCRSEYARDCRLECRAGIRRGEITGRIGIDRLACEKLCLMTSCASSCGGKIP